MVKYQRITIIEREEISRGVASGHSMRKIAKSLIGRQALSLVKLIVMES